jgi:polyisoprenoid-binding protein YceI/rhodanese-related sulfurtransferase
MNAPTELSGLLSPTELHHWTDSGKPLLLLNIMGEDCHAEARIPGSAQACVYETAFLDNVQQLNPDTGASIVVYGTGAPHSLAAQVAAEKLRAAGHTHVYELDGGLAAWQAAGYPVDGTAASESSSPASSSSPAAATFHSATAASEATQPNIPGSDPAPRPGSATSSAPAPSTPPPATPPPLDGTFTLDREKSLIRWTGKNLLNHHEGTVRLTSGEIVIDHGRLKHAWFTIDMRTLACADLTDATWNARFIQHLMDADFFDTANFPEATFSAESVTPIPKTTPGMPSHHLTGLLTLRGKTDELTFPAIIGTADNGQTLGAQAELHFDRTRWGAIYGSGKFFDRLGQHLVNDLVHLHVKIVAAKTAA